MKKKDWQKLGVSVMVGALMILVTLSVINFKKTKEEMDITIKNPITEENFQNESDMEEKVDFLFYVKSFSDFDNDTCGFVKNHTLMHYNHDYTTCFFSKQELKSYQINGAEGTIFSASIGGKDYIGMSKDSSICYEIGNLKPGEEKEIIVPEFEELENIEEKIYGCSIREKCQFLLALYTGMREEEVCGIHKEDFNFEEKYVCVNRAVVQNQETREYVEDKTKSQKSVRKIPLPNKFFEVLEEYYVYRKSFVDFLKYQTNNTYIEIPNVFLSKNGDLYRPYRVSRLWSKFAKENNINLTFHGLRHYYITNQMNYNDNLSERDVQELAGHSNINTTYKYVHSSKSRIQNNATNLFTRFSKEELYKNGSDTLTIPITHIATIILGNPKLFKTDDLQITLAELSNSEVDFFNISNVMEECKDYLLLNYPSLEKIEKYRHSNENEKNVITDIIKEFGNEIVIDKEYELNDSLSL